MPIAIDGLADAVAEELRAYRQEVTQELFEAVDDAADTCVAMLRSTSPKDTGDYSKGWRKKKAYQGDDDIRIQIHNATNYQRTHLLEDGHANVGGGRTEGIPHIEPAAQKASELLEKDVKVRVGKQ